MFILCLGIFLTSAYFGHSFFYVSRSENNGPEMTDAQRVKELYNTAKFLRAGSNKRDNNCHNKILAAFDTMKMIVQIKYLAYINGANHHNLKGRFYHVPYYFQNKKFILLIPNHSKFDINILSVLHNGVNITKEIQAYAGPEQNWHGTKSLCPQDLGYSELCFIYMNEEGRIVSRKFASDQNICLKSI